jgi:phage-related protein (TIGR01555 family)
MMVKKNISNINVYDDWNAFLGYLSKTLDKRVDTNTRKDLTYQQLENWYSKNGIVSKICDKPAEHMIKTGIDIDNKKSDKIYDLYSQYDIWSVLEEALKYDNVFGGSAIIFDVDDGLDWSEPINFNNIRALNDIIVVDRFFLTSENFSYLKKPEFYTLSEKQIKIHNSRIAIFIGLDCGLRKRFANQGFGESRINRCKTELENYTDSHNSLVEILATFKQNIFKFKDMTKNIQDDTKKDIVARKISYLQANSQLAGALAIDQEDDYISRTLNVSGLDKIIDMIERRLCASAGIPHTHLLEEGTTAGLSNNGSNTQESKQWNDYIKSQQIKKLTKPIDLINKIFASILKLGKTPIKWEFNPLETETQEQIINNRNKQSEIDKKLIEMGIPKELIIEKRLGTGYYSFETNFTQEELNIIKDNIKNGRDNINNSTTINNTNNTDNTKSQVK